MTPKRIIDPQDPLWTQVLHTYTTAFPPVERRDVSQLPKLLGEQRGFRSFAFCDKETYIGFMHFWLFSSFSYLEHFAIDATIRRKGYGSKVFRWLLDQIDDTPLILEVEPPIDEVSRQRITFYERHGLRLLDTPYSQPPYRPTDEELPLRLMSTKGQLPDTVIQTIRSVVYGYAE